MNLSLQKIEDLNVHLYNLNPPPIPAEGGRGDASQIIVELQTQFTKDKNAKGMQTFRQCTNFARTRICLFGKIVHSLSLIHHSTSLEIGTSFDPTGEKGLDIEIVGLNYSMHI